MQHVLRNVRTLHVRRTRSWNVGATCKMCFARHAANMLEENNVSPLFFHDRDHGYMRTMLCAGYMVQMHLQQMMSTAYNVKFINTIS